MDRERPFVSDSEPNRPSTSGDLQCVPKRYAPTMFEGLTACREVLGLLLYNPQVRPDLCGIREPRERAALMGDEVEHIA